MNLHAAIFWGWIACGSLSTWWEMRLYLQGRHGMPDVLDRTLLDKPRFVAVAMLSVLFGPLSLGLLLVTLYASTMSRWRSRFAGWRLEHDFRRAERRMQRCKHARTFLTDCGTGLNTPKCLDCWALCHGKTCGGADFWMPNSASPRQARRLTEELQRERQS